MFSEVLDEIEPEDPLNEIDSASLPAPRKRGQFPCDECEMVCRNQFLLSRHKRARHETNTSPAGSSRCNHCGSLWISAASCKDHMAQCQQSQVCDFSAFWKIFSFVTFLCQTFIPQHFWQIPKCKCSGACNCENLSDLLHNNCSLAPSSFNCDHCKKSFANDKNLARHVEKFHRGGVYFLWQNSFF